MSARSSRGGPAPAVQQRPSAEGAKPNPRISGVRALLDPTDGRACAS
jgi:hypothetical protein